MMSNPIGKVDVAREQERRARLQLLDDIREPSPTPIFGEPVKVDLEDETSRRIKKTLGEYQQVLINDPKNLIGISRPMMAAGHPMNVHAVKSHAPIPPNQINRSTPMPKLLPNGDIAPVGWKVGTRPTTQIHPPSRSQQPNKKQPFIPNEALLHKPPSSNLSNCMFPKVAPDKQPSYYNRPNPPQPPPPPPPPPPPQAMKPTYPQNVPPSQSYPTQDSRNPWEKASVRRHTNPQMPNYNVDNSLNMNTSMVAPSSCSMQQSGPIGGMSMPNMVSSYHPQANVPPPGQAKPYGQNPMYPNLQQASLPRSEPASNAPPQKRQYPFRPTLYQQKKPIEAPIAVETILKEMTKAVPAPLTAIQTPRTEESGFSFPTEAKEDLLGFLNDAVGFPKTPEEPESKPPETFQPPATGYGTSSLQDDLEMSESDSEETPQARVPDPTTSSPTGTVDVEKAPVVEVAKMDPHSASSNSSSSESGDSDSDDSSSESNDSDSSSDELMQVANSEDLSSKKWALSNFVDESRRNHSPAFLQAEAQAKAESLRCQAEILRNTSVVNPNISIGVNEPPSRNDNLTLPLVDSIGSISAPVISTSSSLECSQIHTAIGPRTPPSPPFTKIESSENDVLDQEQTSEDQNETGNVTTDLCNTSQSDASKKSFDSEEKGNVQNEKCKKQCSVKSKSDDNLGSEISLKDKQYDKNEADMTHDKTSFVQNQNLSELTSAELPEKTDDTSDDYPIKLRQRVTTPGKKKKSSKNSSDGSEKANLKGASTVSKQKHPRACRLSTEVKNEKPPKPIGIKSNKTENDKKRQKDDMKDDLVKMKSSAKVSVKSLKNPMQSKNKSIKVSKPESDIKKSDSTKKKKKFVLKDFLQSPNLSENGRTPSALPAFSPSPERSPIPESASIVQSDISQSVSSKSPRRSTCKNSAKAEKLGKLRRSTRCSERATSSTELEANTQSNTGKSKKTVKHTGKGKSQVESIAVPIDSMSKMLSSVPQESLDSSSLTESANSKILVCIPLSKLYKLSIRLPFVVQKMLDSETKALTKSRSHVALSDEPKQQKKESEKISKCDSPKHSQSKDFKDKPRTLPSVSKKTKNIFSNKETSSKLRKISKDACNSSSSNGIKCASNQEKTHSEVDNKLVKKRKNDDAKGNSKKKLKSSEDKSKEQSTSGKKDLNISQTEDSNKIKKLERCDSASSLSSLCSQQSQKSSKSSKSKKDFNLIKTLPAIKKEKDDAVHIKKELSSAVTVEKQKSREKLSSKEAEPKDKTCDQMWSDTSSQYCHWDESCKKEATLLVSNFKLVDSLNPDLGTDWEWGAPEMHKELKEASALNKHNKQTPIMPMDYYWTEGNKQKQLAEKEKDPYQQAVKFFEAAVLFILTSQQKEESSKDPDSIYQFYRETLKFSSVILGRVQKLQQCPGNTEFKLLILCLKCQSLLYVKLYNLKIKDIKEQLDGVNDFLSHHSSNDGNGRNSAQLFHPPRISTKDVSSPHSSIPSPASSVNSQTSGYSSGDANGNSTRNNSQSISVPKTILDMIRQQHTHFINLHMGHDLWEQADMYMTRSNLREFFKEVGDQSEPLTLHSSVKELVSYIQKGISMIKKSLR